MLKRFFFITLLLGWSVASLPSLANAASPCSPAKPASQPIAVASESTGTLHIAWQIGETAPRKEWILYWSEKQSLQKYENEPALKNGTARAAELTKLHPGELYDVVLALEYATCVEEKREGNDLGSGTPILAPHWYNRVGGSETRFPEGEVVTVHWSGYINLPTVIGTTSNDIYCKSIDADGTVENPKGGEAGLQSITKFAASECSQSGYCVSGKPELLIKTLPVKSDMFTKPNWYRFLHMKIAFVVRCSGKNVANIVGATMIPYISNGGYSVSAPPELISDASPFYVEHYGPPGTLELEGSHGTQIIQPGWYWPFLGYEKFLNDVIPSETP